MPGRANMSIGPLVPVDVENTYGFLDYFFAADTDPDWIADYLVLDDQVGAGTACSWSRCSAGCARAPSIKIFRADLVEFLVYFYFTLSLLANVVLPSLSVRIISVAYS